MRGRLIAAAVLALLVTRLTGCTSGAVGVSAGYDEYWDGPNYAYGVDYFYAPPVFYGDWGPGYYVGPPRYGAYPHGFPHGEGRPPAFRPAPESRPVPSIPSGPRGGGMRGIGPR